MKLSHLPKGVYKASLVLLGAIFIASFLIAAALPVAQASPLHTDIPFLSGVIVSSDFTTNSGNVHWWKVGSGSTEAYEVVGYVLHLEVACSGVCNEDYWGFRMSEIDPGNDSDASAFTGGGAFGPNNASHSGNWSTDYCATTNTHGLVPSDVCADLAPSAISTGFNGTSIAAGDPIYLYQQCQVYTTGTCTVSDVKLIYYGDPSTPTPTASDTPTITLTPTVTNTPTVSVISYLGDHDYLSDGSFESFPFLNLVGLSPWATSWLNGTVNRQTFSPAESWASNQPVSPLCGGSFYQVDATPGDFPAIGQFDHAGPYVEQGFDWPGGVMYVNMGAQTSDANTQGFLQLQKPDNSIAVLGPDLSSLTGWYMNFWQVSDAPAGHYTVQVKARTMGATPGHLAVDAIAVHQGYWVNDCGVPPELWSKENRAESVQTATPSGPTATLSAAEMTSMAATRIYGGNGTQTINLTATQYSYGTATHVAGITATHNSVALTQGWHTATAIANGVATLIAGGSSVFGHETQTQQAYGLTATAIHVATATAFVGNFRGTLTAAPHLTQTQVSIFQTQNAGIYATLAVQQTLSSAHLTATAAHIQTEAAVPPINIPLTLAAAQLTQQARLNLTNGAILTQQANQVATINAQLTSAPNATTQAQATALAQLNLTLQAIATLQSTQALGATATAQGQTGGQVDTTLPPLTDFQWDEGCIRPNTALNIPMWIDYSTCRFMSWFTWQDFNSQQVAQLTLLAEQREPFATVQAFIVMLRELTGVFANIDWNSAQACDGDMMQLIQPAGPILQGNLILTPVDPLDPNCTLPFESVVGTQIQQGICYGYNLLCSRGILQLIRWAINVTFVMGFIAYIWANWVSKANN